MKYQNNQTSREEGDRRIIRVRGKKCENPTCVDIVGEHGARYVVDEMSAEFTVSRGVQIQNVFPLTFY